MLLVIWVGWRFGGGLGEWIVVVLGVGMCCGWVCWVAVIIIYLIGCCYLFDLCLFCLASCGVGFGMLTCSSRWFMLWICDLSWLLFLRVSLVGD